MITSDPARLADLFTYEVDGHEAQFVRPADTSDIAWAVYDWGQYADTPRRGAERICMARRAYATRRLGGTPSAVGTASAGGQRLSSVA
ncbi:hypothetical protein [Streptomyces monashensis]|uniref:Uncharacterized protein n=1 Tax=Streptomyces monashensis TaxID=1678012 RepID=A0A1S2P0X3_9ACTN|nr:hypothetical protein [Streptomyces monashensis]OIJ86774.1 hypothetical protein BIV23_43625 [Streptomyces monashensis]